MEMFVILMSKSYWICTSSAPDAHTVSPLPPSFSLHQLHCQQSSSSSAIEATNWIWHSHTSFKHVALTEKPLGLPYRRSWASAFPSWWPFSGSPFPSLPAQLPAWPPHPLSPLLSGLLPALPAGPGTRTEKGTRHINRQTASFTYYSPDSRGRSAPFRSISGALF